ncbi:MAG: 2-oxo acid dehydrogenase subunit E2 [Clostridia bacterium]|nr:2-oxo acid dehydrogenase subunit E2 [Clostridia bacterium]
MFGRRPDGRRVKNMDPMVQITPYLMPQRVDAQVVLLKKLDYEVMSRSVAQKNAEGVKITFMHILMAAYERGVSQVPEANRFVVNKQVFSRTELTSSVTILRDTKDGSVEETTCKVFFDPSDTIYDVAARVGKITEENRSTDSDDATLKLAKTVMSIPLLPNIVVGLAKLLDRYGLLPKVVLDMLPFHTGLFVANMASIGMNAVYHHIYNFGNTTLFMGMGRVEREVVMDPKGNVRNKRIMPVGICADERVCAGAVFGQLFQVMLDHLKHPEKLELPPEKVVYDPGCEYHVAKPENVFVPEKETVSA